MKNLTTKGEIWFVKFPLEENPNIVLKRPVLVLDTNPQGVLSVKITKHKVRDEDLYDIPIIYWEDANLDIPSTARVSKILLLDEEDFIFRIGSINEDDLKRIENAYIDFLKYHEVI